PFVLEEASQLTVNDQIGIPTDRRCEVAIVRGRESVMTAALLAVEGLALGSQQEIREEPLLGLALDLAQQTLEGGRRDFLESPLQLVAEALEALAQIHEPVGVGPVVHAVDRGLAREEEFLRDRLVGGEHELLD